MMLNSLPMSGVKPLASEMDRVPARLEVPLTRSRSNSDCADPAMSISSMPAVIQYVTTIVPARYFLVALRGIVLKGLSLYAVWPSLLALGIYAFAVLGISSARLARRAG